MFGAPWQRSLSLDLDVIEAWGARIVVTLIEDHELAMVSVTDIGERTRERQISWLTCPSAICSRRGPTLSPCGHRQPRRCAKPCLRVTTYLCTAVVASAGPAQSPGAF